MKKETDDKVKEFIFVKTNKKHTIFIVTYKQDNTHE